MCKTERLAKCLGVSSRKAKKLITEGRVKVNGIVSNSPCHRIDNTKDKITVDGVKVRTDIDEHIYLKMWKPAGVECTEQPWSQNGISVKQFMRVPTQNVKSKYKVGRSNRLFSIGRLDKATSGLLLFTSDGQLAQDISYKYCEKEYLVALDRHVSDEDLQKLRKGVIIDHVVTRSKKEPKVTKIRTLPAKVDRSAYRIEEEKFDVDTILSNDWIRKGVSVSLWPFVAIYPYKNQLKMVIPQGRNRQIKRMLETVGAHVTALHRTKFAGITLENVVPGEGKYTLLTDAEITLLRVQQEAIKERKKEVHKQHLLQNGVSHDTLMEFSILKDLTPETNNDHDNSYYRNNDSDKDFSYGGDHMKADDQENYFNIADNKNMQFADEIAYEIDNSVFSEAIKLRNSNILCNSNDDDTVYGS